MKKIMGVVGGRLALFAFLLFLAAGCNGAGVGGDDSVPAATSLSLPSGDTFSGLGDSGMEGSGTVVAKVHNPEPASMVLMGIGLAALLRRRSRVK